MVVFVVNLSLVYQFFAPSALQFSVFKACVRYFHQMIALQKVWKILFISYKKLFPFLRYSNFCIFVLPSFSMCQPLLWRVIEDKSKLYDIINCLNKNSVTHFVWYLEKEKRYDIETLSIDGVSDKEHFYRKIMLKMCSKS